MKKVFIKNRKSQNISVVLEINKNPKGLAFIMHGLGGFKEQAHIQTITEAFREKNYSVVLFDTTNSIGESDGNYEKATITNYYEDLEDVIQWAKNQSWYQEPFILSGHSLGGFCIAYYAENYPDEILAIAPISPVVSGKLSVEAHQRYESEAFKRWEETGWESRESSSKPGVIKKLPWSHIENRLKYDLLPKVGNLAMPILLVVGENDTSTPSDHVKKLFDLLPGKKEMHVISGASHDFRKKEELQEVKSIFLHWIDKIK